VTLHAPSKRDALGLTGADRLEGDQRERSGAARSAARGLRRYGLLP
jgi:hypothetical protein